VIPNRSRLGPWRAAALAALLLLAQALGLAHAVAHGLGPAGSAESAAHQGPDDGHGHEAGSAECRLVDAHGGVDMAAGGAAAPAPALPAAARAVQRLAPRVALAPRWARLARGPPR